MQFHWLTHDDMEFELDLKGHFELKIPLMATYDMTPKANNALNVYPYNNSNNGLIYTEYI